MTATRKPTAVRTLVDLAEAQGWSVEAQRNLDGDETEFVATRGTRRLTVTGDVHGRVREASTPRSSAVGAGKSDWAARVLTGELPSGPKRTVR